MELAKKELNVASYSDKSFIVFGELTRDYKDHLKGFGGKFNGRLKPREGFEGGPAWIFSNKHRDVLEEFASKVQSGDISPIDLPTGSETGLPTVNNMRNTTYQWAKFKIFKPENGMSVTLKVNGKELEGTVTSTEIHNNLVDTVYIDFDGKTSMGVIQNGKWKIKGYMVDHTLFFNRN